MLEAPVVTTPPKPFLSMMKGNRAGVWTTIGGGVLVLVVWQLALVLLGVFVLVVQRIMLGQDAPTANEEAKGMAILLLGGFGPAFIVLMLWRQLVERGSIKTLFTAKPRFRWSLALLAALFVGGLGLALTLGLDPDSVAQIKERIERFTFQDWLLLCLAYGVGISVQASFEEVYVRGWLLQHVNRIFPHVFGSIVMTSIVFSLLHVGHPGWATYVVTFVMGLAFGWSAWRLGGLEAAMGAHIGNNLVGALLSGQMISGNPPSMDLPQIGIYVVYVLGFLLFVEGWARFFGKPSRA